MTRQQVRELVRRVSRRAGAAMTDLGEKPFSTHRATMRDSASDARLKADGYVVVDLLTEAETSELLDLCRTLHVEPTTTWQSDFYSPDDTVKRTVHERIAAAFVRGIDERFVDHRSLLHNFVMNWPGPDGGLVLHQHSSVVDEHRMRSVVVWCALNEATEDNGTLHVVPRSHLIQVGPRPERSPGWYEPHVDMLLRDHLVSVPVRPGQALVFDNQLLHCSFPNSADAPRLTAAAVVIPREAEPRYYEVGDHGTTRVHRLDPEFFMTNQAGNLQWARPDGLDLIGEEPWSPTTIEEEELRLRLPRGDCRHFR